MTSNAAIASYARRHEQARNEYRAVVRDAGIRSFQAAAAFAERLRPAPTPARDPVTDALDRLIPFLSPAFSGSGASSGGTLGAPENTAPVVVTDPGAQSSGGIGGGALILLAVVGVAGFVAWRYFRKKAA